MILLYKNKLKIFDRDVYYKLYGGKSNNYTMIKGAPLLLNINGTLVDINSISNAVVHKKDLAKVNEYIANVCSVNEPAANIKFRLIYRRVEIMNYLFLVSHGSGSEFMQCSIIRDFAKGHSNDKIYISAINKYFADMVEAECDNVKSIDRNTIQPLFTQIMQDKHNWTFYSPEVYQQPKFFLRMDNFYDTYRELIGMKRLGDWSSAGSKYNPMLYVPADFEKAAKQFSEAHPRFILFQRKGGINPVCSREERIRAASSPEVGLIRSWPMKESVKFVAEANKLGYEVVQYKLPEEEGVEGAIFFSQENNQLFYIALAKYAAAVVTIDSSLMHLAIANSPKTIVIWGQSASDKDDCRGFGYEKAINLFAKNYKPISPYFNGMPDTPVIEMATAEDVVAQLTKKAS